MTHPSITAPNRTALLTLDLQPCIFALASVPDAVKDKAVKAVEGAREKGIQIIHVGLAFSDGYPELRTIVTGEASEAKPQEGRVEWELW